MQLTTRTGVMLACALAFAGSARADRHGVEPAEMLGRGDCEAEFRLHRIAGKDRRGELEAGCRVGPLQVGGAAEVERHPGDAGTGTGARSATVWATEFKWARRGGDWRFGAMMLNDWQAHERPRYAGTTLIALAGYELRDDLRLSLNLGREFVRREEDGTRAGVGLEWNLDGRWTALAERYRREQTHFGRAGVRWAAGHHGSIEAARAQRLAGPERSRWVLTVTIDLDDD